MQAVCKNGNNCPLNVRCIPRDTTSHNVLRDRRTIDEKMQSATWRLSGCRQHVRGGLSADRNGVCRQGRPHTRQHGSDRLRRAVIVVSTGPAHSPDSWFDARPHPRRYQSSLTQFRYIFHRSTATCRCLTAIRLVVVDVARLPGRL